MNIIQLAMKAEIAQGVSKAAATRRKWRDRGFEVGTRFAGKAVSRQTARAILRDAEYAAIKTHSHAPRKERRQMARAIASGKWKAQQKAKAAIA